MSAAIELHHVSKRYRSFVAVDDVTLSIEAGSICGLLGPNGAGKTTTFKCLLGFTRPTSGSIAIGGAAVGPTTFESLAYVAERASLYDELSLAQHFVVYRRTYRSFDATFARALVERFDLDPSRRADRLSKGMRTAAALVLAFAIRPRILILDEPSSGLDPIHQRQVLDLMIEAAANGATVLFSSHHVGQVERAADRVAILNRGRLIVDASIDDLKSGEKIVEAVFAGDVPPLGELEADARIVRVERAGSMLRAVTCAETDEVAQRIFALRPRSLRIIDLNLEDIFVNAIAGDRV